MEDRRLRKTDPLPALRAAKPGQPAQDPDPPPIRATRFLDDPEATARAVRWAVLVSAVPVGASLIATLLIALAPTVAALLPFWAHLATLVLALPPLAVLGFLLGWPRTRPASVLFPAAVGTAVALVALGQITLALWPTDAPIRNGALVGAFCVGLTLCIHAVPLAVGMAVRDRLRPPPPAARA